MKGREVGVWEREVGVWEREVGVGDPPVYHHVFGVVRPG